MFKDAMYLSRIRSEEWLREMRTALAIKGQHKRAYHYETPYFINRCFSFKKPDLCSWQLAVLSTRWSQRYTNK